MNYHIKQCQAPCQGYVTPEQYQQNFSKALKLLEGDFSEVLEMLEAKMAKAVEELAFEEAASCRDLIASVKKVAVHQKVTDFGGVDRDVIAMAQTNLEGIDGDAPEELVQSFIKQFYAGTPFIPRELMVEYELEEKDLISDWLSERRGGKVSILAPKKGQKERLVELAHKNAALVLTQDAEKLRREEERTLGAMQEIADLLGMSEVKRVESYDISNISGFQSVGSMVVFENGKPKRSDYRKFRIKTVQGPDDGRGAWKKISSRSGGTTTDRSRGKSNGRLYGVPGFDHDGWRERPSECCRVCFEGARNSDTGLRHGER